jgi:hypothetical protein
MSCIKEGCKEPKTENAYCKKHKVYFLIEEGEKRGEKVCSNVIRGCREVNDMTYPKKKCETCLEKERSLDKARRMTKEEVEEGEKQCTTCSQIYPLDQFKGRLGETKTCFTCREQNKRADAKRDMDHIRELARTNDKKPERKAVKQAWKDANFEKCSTYWMEKRKRDITKDIEAYLKKNAEQAKKWRDANPEKNKQINLNKKNSIVNNYKTYQLSASDKNLDFKFSFEEYEQLVRLPCYYCGTIEDKGFNGIDRLNSTEPYIQSNCVSCCTMCNMMKGSSGPNVFVHRAEHILTNLKIIQGQSYPDDFLHFSGSSYSAYKARAEKKDLPFEISQETFTHYTDLPCYLCGKEISETHSNGIDRYDNTKGYTLDNIRSCCGTCNYIKKNYDYDEMVQKFCLICNYQQEHPVALSPYKEERRTIVKGNKVTSEEKQERDAIRKEVNRKALVDRYGDDDFIKARATELALKRAEKQADGLKE